MDRLLVRSRTTGVVSLVYLRLLFEHLSAVGEDPERILGEPWPDMDPNQMGRYPLERFCDLLLKAARHLDDPLLGLHVGQRVRLAHLGVLGYVLLNCETIGAAMERMLRYQRLVNDHTHVHQKIDPRKVELRWGGIDGRPGALFDELGITALTQFARDISGKHLRIGLIDFINPPPENKQEFLDFFGGEVRFSQLKTRVQISTDDMMLPLRQPDPLLRRVLEEQVDRLMAGLPSTGSLDEAVRRAVMRAAPDGEPSLERVAAELSLSPRVLYRRLASENLSFRTLRDAALRVLAEKYLADQRLSLPEVALLIGYSEQSAFTRAFKRWTGRAPSHARSELSSAAPASA